MLRLSRSISEFLANINKNLRLHSCDEQLRGETKSRDAEILTRILINIDDIDSLRVVASNDAIAKQFDSRLDTTFHYKLKSIRCSVLAEVFCHLYYCINMLN